MSEESKKYVPSPWLQEDLKKEQVRVPPAIVGALYRLQQDKNETEYGGAIDFEMVKGKPAVERVLSYTGVARAVPAETWEKVFMNPDIELTFHTHPGQTLAIPSEGDIIFFLTTDPGAMLIFAQEEASLLVKGAGTPPAAFAREHMEKYEATARRATRTPAATTRKAQEEMVNDLKRELDIDMVIFPATKPIDIALKIVQDVSRQGPRLKIFD